MRFVNLRCRYRGCRDYFPAADQTFAGDLAGMDAVGILAKAPTPTEAARLPVAQIRSALKTGGRQRNIDTKAVGLQQLLRSEHLYTSPIWKPGLLYE